jgi:DNA-binding transcriptional LysR family regulator
MASLRIAFVPGVTLGKWSRIWDDRFPDSPLTLIALGDEDPSGRLRDGSADMVFARLPVDADGLHRITLYEEAHFVVLPKEHALAEEKRIAVEDLEGEQRFDLDPALDLDAAVEVVASGVGIAVMPQSLARLHSRKGVVSRPLDGVPETTIALLWPTDATGDMEAFVGVVRGRTANSSRDQEEAPAQRPTAKAKAKAAEAARLVREAKASKGGKKAVVRQPRKPAPGRGRGGRRG